MSTVKSKKLQVGTDATSSNNFTIYQPATPDGTLRIGVGDAENPTEVARITADGIESKVNPAFVARMSTTQAIPESTWTKIEFNVQDADIGGCYDQTTNYRFTVPSNQDGLYQINFWAYIACGTTNCRNVALRILLNGTTELKRGYLNFFNGGDATGGTVGHSSVLSLSAGDYLEVYGYVNSTDDLGGNVSAGAYSSFSGFKLIQQA